MGTKAKGEERKFILECIKMYERLPALWNTKNKDYNDRIKKNEQYEQLLQKYKEYYPYADKTQLVKKLNSLRTNFRKEVNRIKSAAETSGSGTEACKPNLWYYDAMLFILNHSRVSTDSNPSQTYYYQSDLEYENDGGDEGSQDFSDSCNESYLKVNDIETYPESSINTTSYYSESRPNKRKNIDEIIIKTENDLFGDEIENSFKTPTMISTTEQSETFGRFMITQLKLIEEADAELFLDVQHNISNILYAARKKFFQSK